MGYGKSFHPTLAPLHEGFSITRATIELSLDEILKTVDISDNILDFWMFQYLEPTSSNNHDLNKLQVYHEKPQLQDVQNPYATPAPPIAYAATITPTSGSPPTLPTAVLSPHQYQQTLPQMQSCLHLHCGSMDSQFRGREQHHNDSDSEDSNFAINRHTLLGEKKERRRRRKVKKNKIKTQTERRKC